MSFFKKLFAGKNEQAAEPAAPAEEAADALPELFEGMSLDVITPEDGKLLLTGRVSSISGTSLTLERLPGWLSFDTCEIGDEVYVRGFNRRMTSFNMRATVVESSRIICRVKNLKVEHIVNQRLSYRLPVNCAATLYRQDDERFSRPEECVLVDISTGGACVESEYVHAEDEVLRVRFKLEEYPTMTFLGQIVRAFEYSNGRYRYGILFAQLKQDELTTLTRTMYNIQTGNRKAWQQSKGGPWI